MRSHVRTHATDHSMKRALIAIVLLFGRLLYVLRLHPLIIWLGRRSPKVLVYHACEDTESAFIRGLGTNTHPEELADQLRYLERYYRIVTLAELEAEPTTHRAVVLTFDDGYRSVFDHALPQLRGRAASATVYVVAEALRDGGLVWVNELAWWYNTRRSEASRLLTRDLDLPPDSPLATIIEIVRARYDRKLVEKLLASLRALSDGGEPPPSDDLYLGRAEIAEMAAAGFTFGNHSRTHPNLARLPEVEQQAEIMEAQHLIDELPGRRHSLAYPFGAFDARTRRLATELGFTSLMEVGGRNHPLRLDRVARVPVAHGGAAELFVLMEIVNPLKALARSVVR